MFFHPTFLISLEADACSPFDKPLTPQQLEHAAMEKRRHINVALGNLALLNLDINRSYKNDIFPLKRKAIIKKINSGTEFIPPCTVKAFTKFYTKSASRITSWQNADFEGYYNVMNSFFKSFMELKTELPKSCNETGNLFTAEDDYFAPEGQAQSHSGENDKP